MRQTCWLLNKVHLGLHRYGGSQSNQCRHLDYRQMSRETTTACGAVSLGDGDADPAIITTVDGGIKGGDA